MTQELEGALRKVREALEDSTRWISVYAAGKGEREFVQSTDRYGDYLEALALLDQILAEVPEEVRYAQQVLNGLNGQILFDGNREQLSLREVNTIGAALRTAALLNTITKEPT